MKKKQNWLQRQQSSLTTNWRVEQYIANAILLHDGKLSLRDHLYRALASPGSSSGALLTAVLLQGLSMSSVAISAYQLDREAIEVNEGLTCIKSDPTNPASPCQMEILSIMNWIFAAVFLGELLVRVNVYKSPLADWTVWLDFMTIVPMLMRAVMSRYGIRPLEVQSKGIRTATLLACSFTPLRLLKLGRYMAGIQLLMTSLKKSLSALLIPLYLLIVLFTFFGTLVYAAEYDNDKWDEGGRIQTISDGYWMILVTMTTVGYGDYSPKTATGRILVGFVMLFGLCFLAMPLAIVGNTFSESWDRSSSVTVSEALRKKMLEAGQNPNDVDSAFLQMDSRNRGFFSYNDFKYVIGSKLNLRMGKEELRKVWRALDADGSDSVGMREFTEIFFPDMEPEEFEAEASAALGGDLKERSVLSSSSSGLNMDATGAIAHVESRIGAVEASLAGQNALASMLQQSLNAQEEQRRTALAQQTELQQTITHLLDSRLNSVEAGVAGQNSLAGLLKDSLAAQEELRQKLVMQQAEQQQLVKQLITSVQLLGNLGGRALLGSEVTQPLALTE
jgi:hypothetical protein